MCYTINSILISIVEFFFYIVLRGVSMKLKNKNKIFFMIIFFLFIFIGVGYAALSSSLKLDSTATMEANTWDVTSTIIYKDGNATNSEVSINDSNVTFSTKLSSQYDYYNYLIKVSNNGTIDAVLKELPTLSLTT